MSFIVWCELGFRLSDIFSVRNSKIPITLEKGPMTEYVVFFRKHAVLNVLAFYLVYYISPKMCHIKVVFHPNGPFGYIQYTTIL